MIGRHLCDHFLRGGWTVRALARAPSHALFGAPDIQRFDLDLPDTLDVRAFQGADVVVHAAWATLGQRGKSARRTNEEGTARVLRDARSSGVRRFVFLSSLSAHEDARSYYGRSKFAMERLMDPGRDLVVRPGLVLAPDGGVAYRLWRTIARLHVAPLFSGGKQIVQTVHIADLCAALTQAIDRDITGSIDVAETEGITMRDLVRALAQAAGVRCATIPIPGRASVAVVRAMEALHLPLPVSSENILGLLALRRVDTEPDLRRLGIRLRAARESIADLAPVMKP